MFAESIHTAPSSCKVKAGTVVPLRLAPSGFPALAPWGVCACGLSREVCLRKVFLLDAIFFGAHLLEPPRPAPFPEHMSTLEVQLERYLVVFCKLQHLVLVTLADCTSVSAGFGQGGNFCVNVQTLTVEMCIIYPAYSHITFSRLISNRSTQRASPHLEFLKMFCYCII